MNINAIFRGFPPQFVSINNRVSSHTEVTKGIGLGISAVNYKDKDCYIQDFSRGYAIYILRSWLLLAYFISLLIYLIFIVWQLEKLLIFFVFNQVRLFYLAVEIRPPSRILSAQQWTRRSLFLKRKSQPCLCLPNTKMAWSKDLLIQRYIMLHLKRKRLLRELVKSQKTQQILVRTQYCSIIL